MKIDPTPASDITWDDVGDQLAPGSRRCDGSAVRDEDVRALATQLWQRVPETRLADLVALARAAHSGHPVSASWRLQEGAQRVGTVLVTMMLVNRRTASAWAYLRWSGGAQRVALADFVSAQVVGVTTIAPTGEMG